MHIFVKEAFAANQGAQATRGIPRLMLIDNQPLVFAIKKGLSSNKLLNEWLRTWDLENITVRWVSTTQQKADKYTRGTKAQMTASTKGVRLRSSNDPILGSLFEKRYGENSVMTQKNVFLKR